MEDGETEDQVEQEGEKVDETVKDDPIPIKEDVEDYKALKEANDKLEEELLRKEQLRAKRMQGGRSEAGIREKTQDELDEEAAKLFMQEDE